MRTLYRLRRLRSLGHLGATPVDLRFHEKLLKQWSPLIKSLSRKYAIPRRLEREDIEQELSVVLWNLTLRVDPASQPDDFRRLLAAEMRNRCIDLTRYHRAQKRRAKVGKGIQCFRCNTVTPWIEGSPLECEVCGADIVRGRKKNGKLVDIYAPDVSLEHEHGVDDPIKSEDHNNYIPVFLISDSRQDDPVESYVTQDVIDSIRQALQPFPERKMFDLYVDPPRDFVQLLLDYGYAANPRRVPYWLLSKYLGDINEKLLRVAFTKIGLVVAEVVNKPGLIEWLSPYNLSQLTNHTPKKIS